MRYRTAQYESSRSSIYSAAVVCRISRNRSVEHHKIACVLAHKHTAADCRRAIYAFVIAAFSAGDKSALDSYVFSRNGAGNRVLAFFIRIAIGICLLKLRICGVIVNTKRASVNNFKNRTCACAKRKLISVEIQID